MVKCMLNVYGSSSLDSLLSLTKKMIVSNLCYWGRNVCLTLSSLNLPLSSPSTTSRELLSQFSTCSGWKWLEVGYKWKNILLFLKQFHEFFCSKITSFQGIKPFFKDAKFCFNASRGLKGLNIKISKLLDSKPTDMSNFYPLVPC